MLPLMIILPNPFSRFVTSIGCVVGYWEFLSCGDDSFRLVLKEGVWNRKTPNYVVGDTVFQTLWNGGAYNAKHNWCPNPLYTARTLGRPTCISEDIHTRQR